MSDELLHAMSTKPTLSVDQLSALFRRVYHPASLEDEEWVGIGSKQPVMRLFEALGFCEFDYEQRRVHMCPPTLVLLPGGAAPRALLTGARTPTLTRTVQQAVKHVSKRARFYKQRQDGKHINMPTCIVVEAVDKMTLSKIGHAAKIDTDLDEPAAWKIAKLSANMRTILAQCAFERRQEPNWPRRVFREDQLVFSKGVTSPDGAPWFAEYTSPINRQRRHWYWQEDGAAEVNRDWGRYLALSHHKRNIILYDARSRDLVLPVTTPLPTLLARAAALSGGRVPGTGICVAPGTGTIPLGHPVLVFRDVPQEIAEEIASKVEQRLVPVDSKETVQR